MATRELTQGDLFGPPAKPATAEERNALLVAAYLAGEPMDRVGARFGVGIGTVSRAVKAAGVKARSPLKDITPGTEFGRLRAREYLGNSRWLCDCACGGTEVANATALRKGRHVRCAACRLPEKPPERKTCTTCGTEYPNTPEFFFRNQQFRLGLTARCKRCILPEANASGRARLKSLRYEVLSHYSGGGKPFCVCCLTDTFEFLALDHLEGSSRADYERFGNSERLFSHVKRGGYKLLAEVRCHSCNEAIGHYGACPHRPDITRPVKSRKPAGEPPIPPNYAGPHQSCIHCFRSLPLTPEFFHRNKPMPTGFTTICKTCANAKRGKDGHKERAATRMEVLLHYSSGTLQCACCHESHHQFLTIDHVNGGGRQHREEAGGPLYRHLKRNGFPSDPPMQVLCFNCNLCRGWYGTCVHTK